LIGVETGIKIIAAMHSQCLLWVISGQTVPGQNRPVVRCCPLATKLLRCRDCPLSANSGHEQEVEKSERLIGLAVGALSKFEQNETRNHYLNAGF
jgi:hypothetical protein